MITELKIENYKSIQDLTLEVGRVNVLIGENGCGKSNILEAITFAAAAEANKLDKEFLKNRGIRVTEPQLMRSAFINNTEVKPIKIIAKCNDDKKNIDYEVEYFIHNDNKPYARWEVYPDESSYISKMKLDLVDKMLRMAMTDILSFRSFIIFSPENTILRDFSKEADIEPLGDKGEGLLKLLIYTQNDAIKSKDFSELNDIQDTLELFGWFESIKIPDDFSLLEKKITIKDRYLETPFDQRSANEGFLLVLFYITLVVSKYTPKIFAIDNLDTSLNPKLCTKLIKELTRLAKKYDKQMFITTHNPAILDGIDLGDDEQRLFVISRNDDGHSCCDRITLKDKPKSSTRAKISRVFKNNEDSELFSKQDILNKFDDSEESLKLSEALLRGYLGGLPEGF